MQPSLLYIACVASCVALYVLLRPGRRSLRVLAAIGGLGVVAGLMVGLTLSFSEGAARPPALFSLFALTAIAASARMITHHRPVYSALYFILVVLSSAGLFLMMEAEFMAFALVIVYAGAILVTYLFVIMLAQQAEMPGMEKQQPEYDRIAREPAAAVTVGFVMLAVLCSLIFSFNDSAAPTQRSMAEGRADAWLELAQMPRQLRAAITAAAGQRDIEIGWGDGQSALAVADSGRTATARYRDAEGQPRMVELNELAVPQNTQRVGWALVARFPVSLELAGIILLLAMFGAVVLARRQIELGEDELRRAAGMGPYALDGLDEAELDQTSTPDRGASA